MVNKLAGLDHTYNGSTLVVNKDAHNCCLINVISAIIHQHSHHHTIPPCIEHFLYAILSGETIDVASMIYRTIIFCTIAPTNSSLQYPSLISRWGSIIFRNIPFSCSSRVNLSLLLYHSSCGSKCSSTTSLSCFLGMLFNPLVMNPFLFLLLLPLCSYQ